MVTQKNPLRTCLIVVVFGSIAVACTDSSGISTTGSGGASGTGGAIASGGVSGTGGAIASGGTTAAGGATGQGGATGTGGVTGRGGATGGGTRGGTTGSGGASLTGGTTGTGGATANGGATGAGGASGKGGTTGAGGTTATDAGVAADAAQPGAGCGAQSWPKPTSGTNQTFTIDVNGKTREYIVGLPSNYDSAQKYPLMFAWHGLGGTATMVASGGTRAGETMSGYYGQRYQSNQANLPIIFVSGQGLPSGNADAGNDYGWRNTNGEDINYVKAVLAWLNANYCIDQDRIFSIGMSFGGMMSNTVGCAMGDVFRAIAPMSGAGPGGFGGRNPTCTGQVAAWLAHGTSDTTVTIDSGVASRDFWLAANHCTSTSAATDPSPCVAYDGCDSGYPVVWCEFDGTHTILSFEPLGAWKFFLQFLQ